VYERRELGWRDRLRRLFGRENRGRAIYYSESGEPILVTARGQVLGVRAVNGEVIQIPQQGPQRIPVGHREADREGDRNDQARLHATTLCAPGPCL